MRVYKVWYMICWTHHHVLPDDALTHSLEAPHIYKRALFSLGDREQCPFHKVVYQAFVGFQSNWTFTVSTEALRRPGEAAGRCLFQVQLGNLQPRDRRRLSEAPGGEGRSGLAVLTHPSLVPLPQVWPGGGPHLPLVDDGRSAGQPPRLPCA